MTDILKMVTEVLHAGQNTVAAGTAVVHSVGGSARAVQAAFEMMANNPEQAIRMGLANAAKITGITR